MFYSWSKDKICKRVLFLCCIVYLTGFSQAGRAWKDATGFELKMQKPPQRIVSLVPSITENLYELGAGEKVVGVTIYCNRPEDAKRKEKIGNMLEVNIEKIISLKPDIVFATVDDNRQQVVAKLRELGVVVFVFGREENFNTVCAHFQVLAEIVNARAKAREILKDINMSMEKIVKKLRNLSPVKVFCQLGANPVVTAAEGTFIDEFIQLAKGINIAHSLPGRYIRYSREQVLKENPEVIIITSMGEDTERERKNWSGFTQLQAARNNRIYTVDADLVCRPAPTVLIKGFEEIAKCIHPEAFK